ncbi:MAG TPA: hypothetical protein VMW42_06925 [Desulfatiglandales bacterium]|nr:hypothetical protein [Desulfatiglandales bacterium]
MNILWVDDDIRSAFLNPFADEFKDEGYRIISASSPEEMWNVLAKSGSDVDVIIMDMMLPVGSSVPPSEAKLGIHTGIYLIKKLKEMKKYSNTPIICFSIIGDQEVLDWANREKIIFLKKQETFPDELVSKVKSLSRKVT